MHVIVHRTFEQSDPETAVVEHRFRGRTRDAAWRLYLAHWDQDAFLRGCGEEGYYLSVDGESVPCTVQWWWEEERDAAPRQQQVQQQHVQPAQQQPVQQQPATAGRGGYGGGYGYPGTQQSQPLYYSPQPVARPAPMAFQPGAPVQVHALASAQFSGPGRGGFVPRVIEGGQGMGRARAEMPPSSSTGAAPAGCDAATGA
jgi:hypothetical protein